MNQIITIIKRKITELTQNQDRKVREELENAFLSDEILVKIEDTQKRIDKLSREVEGLRKQNHAYSERYEKKEIESLEADKESLRGRIKELSDENKRLEAEKNELEAGLDSYLKSSPEESIKTIVSVNAAQVAQEKEQQRVEEELAAVRKLLE